MLRPSLSVVHILVLVLAACGDSRISPDSGARDATSSDAGASDAQPVDARPLTPDAAIGSEFNSSYCDMVAGTLDIHWEALSGSEAPCTGVETTDGDPASAAANGSVTISGVSVSDENCIGTSRYEFTLAQGGLSIGGSDLFSLVPMTLRRLPGQACFVGHWVLGADDFRAHISASAFGL